MSQNRISKFFEDTTVEYGMDWRPETLEEKHKLSERCALLMATTMLDNGCKVKLSEVMSAHRKMRSTADMMIEYSLIQSEVNNIEFLKALAISLGALVNVAVQGLAKVAEFNS